MEISNPADQEKRRQRLGSLSVILGVVAVAGSLAMVLFTLIISFGLIGLAGEAAEFVVDPLTTLCNVCLGMFALFPPLGIVLAVVSLKGEANRGLAVAGLVLNCILLCLEGGIISLVVILSR